ncbi:MAG TPA: tetratricopeptide repeat protein, partial [Polyangiales bacterium]
RPLALVLLSVLSLDLGYAVWVNPMGIAARQLGHASGAALALLAGLGAAQLIDSTRARSKLLGLAAVGGGLVASLYLVLGAAWPARADGYAIAERYGATSPLLALRPRSVYLCSSDSACASALFAIYVEAVRPDIAVAPAQHLWDETVTRRLDGLLPASSPPPSAAERRRRADSQFIALLEQAGQRPIALELAPPMAAGVGYDNAPFLEVRARDRSATDDDPELALRALERARFGSAGPKTQLARVLWSSAHADVGTALLYENRFESGLICLRRALELTPERAVAHSNLGVALEKQGDFAGALAETRRAVEIDPARPTPWLNLARLMLRMTGREAALSVLRAADESAVRDPRLTELRAALH